MTKKGYKQTPEHIKKRITKESIRKRLATRFFEKPKYKEKMRKALSGPNNPRYGVKLSAQTKAKISMSEKGKKVIMPTGERNPNWKGGRSRRRNSLLYILRNSRYYKEWRKKVLQKYFPSKIPKGIHIHHLKSVAEIIKENHIQTLDEAIKCKALWDIANVVILKRGEHYIITCLERHKRVSIGFIKFIKYWLERNESKAVEL